MNGSIVIAVALGAAACNLAAVLVLRVFHAGHGHGEDLNMRSAILHMAGDTAASLGVALCWRCEHLVFDSHLGS